MMMMIIIIIIIIIITYQIECCCILENLKNVSLKEGILELNIKDLIYVRDTCNLKIINCLP